MKSSCSAAHYNKFYRDKQNTCFKEYIMCQTLGKECQGKKNKCYNYDNKGSGINSSFHFLTIRLL